MQRRDFLKNSFASVGYAGALTMALGAMSEKAAAGGHMSARAPTGGGDALRGPYLDLTTGRGNQLAYARLQGNLDFESQKYFWFKGYVMGHRPMQKIDDLFGAQGFGVIRLNEREDGVIERMCREIIVYTDLRSEEVLEEWKNPYLDETVRVVHVDNDPYNYTIDQYFPPPPEFGGLAKNTEPPPKIPFILPWMQNDDWLEMEIHIHLAYPNALQPDKWPRESAGKIAQVSEFFAHHVLAEDMQNEKLTTLPYRGTWNRITPWLPWMLMGQAPGNCQYACFMGTCDHPGDVLPRTVVDYAEKNYAKYFEAPTEYEDIGLSSLENYARQQTPAPVKDAG